MELLAWWNLIFVLPFVAALLYLLLQASGLIPVGAGADADMDADVDTDVDLDVDHDVHVEVDMTHHHHFGIDHAHGYDSHDPSSVLEKALSFLGIGRIPLSLIMMSYCIVWGFVGWSSNLILEPILRTPFLFVWISLGSALLVSVVLTRSVARGLSRIMPTNESYATTNESMLGSVAVVSYRITDRSGSARLRDSYGNLQEVPCRVEADESPVEANDKVLLMHYDDEKKVFIVKADPLTSLEKSNKDGLANKDVEGV